jgi:hypothetical protein
LRLRRRVAPAAAGCACGGGLRLRRRVAPAAASCACGDDVFIQMGVVLGRATTQDAAEGGNRK